MHIASSVIELNPNISSKATYYKALLAPDSSSPSQLPALILEDDIWLLDDFPTKVRKGQVQLQVALPWRAWHLPLCDLSSA